MTKQKLCSKKLKPDELFFVTTLVMKKNLAFVILFISGYCFSQEVAIDTKFTPEALREDLEFLFTKLEYTHPELYNYVNRSKVDSARAKINKILQQSFTRLEFARMAIPIITMLKDGHTSLSFPQEERTVYLKSGGTVFPLDVLIRNDKIFATNNYSSDSTLLPYTEILAINGILSSDLLNQMRPFISAELDFYRDIRVQNSFRRLLWYVLGFEGDYNVVLAYNGNVFTRKISGATEMEFMRAYTQKVQPSPQPYSYYKLTDDIGVIDFRSMNDEKRFGKFLDSTFTIIQNDKTQHLVIDIRNNGGGNSQLGDMLFDYITTKKYRQVVEAEIKKEGKVKHVKAGLQSPRKVANKFTGKTYLLTCHYTFSSANMLASAYKFYNMGTIIGEETGGVLTAFGDLVEITLPNTKLKAFCSHKKFVHPGADGELHGVKPDIEIIPSQEDIQLGRDAVMEYVVKYVSKSK
jgi:hypothetical protein